MNKLKIKEIRKKLQLTQNDLAKKLGVSRQTVVNYENGAIIPESKKELLYNILQINTQDANEPELVYVDISGFDKKINSINEEIQTRKNIIKESADQELILHQNKMIELLQLQISEIRKAQLSYFKK